MKACVYSNDRLVINPDSSLPRWVLISNSLWCFCCCWHTTSERGQANANLMLATASIPAALSHSLTPLPTRAQHGYPPTRRDKDCYASAAFRPKRRGVEKVNTKTTKIFLKNSIAAFFLFLLFFSVYLIFAFKCRQKGLMYWEVLCPIPIPLFHQSLLLQLHP